jgi:membrane-associated phospholipid phosphatase
MRADAIRQEWLEWWGGLGWRSRWLPPFVAAAYLGANAALGGLRGDHVALAAAGLGLHYAGPRLRELFRFLFPLLIMAVAYDAQRYWADSLRAPVRVSEPRAWELSWFGIRGPGGLQTPAQWCQSHTRPYLDAVAGVAYLLFIPMYLGYAAWWRFVERRPGALLAMWAMLWLNLFAYATYLAYPAAPPWYVDHYGLGPAVLQAPPEAAGAARFDALFHVAWFAGIYGRNANVFGAIPSLHVGQSFLAVLFAWRFRSLRCLTLAFCLLVTFSSVYLNHHYLVDGVVGIVFAVLASAVVRAWERSRAGGHSQAA